MDNEPGAVVLTVIAHECLAAVAADDAAGVEHIGSSAALTAYLLAVAGEVEHLQGLAVRTAAVVGHGAVEVRAAYDEPRLVAAPQLVDAPNLVLVADDVVLARRLAVVAGNIDMAQAAAAVAGSGHGDIHPRALHSGEGEAGGVRLLLHHELAGIAAAEGVVTLAGADQQDNGEEGQEGTSHEKLKN